MLTDSVDKQLKLLPFWAKAVRQFNELDVDDQVNLLRASKLYLIIFIIQILFNNNLSNFKSPF